MKKIIFLLVAIAMMAITWLAFANDKRILLTNRASEANEVKLKLEDGEEAAADFDDDEKAILKELQDLFKTFSSQKHFYLSGRIDMHTPADTTQSKTSSQFDFSKKDELIYYQNDAQQSINTLKYFAVVDHVSKKIIVSPPKDVQEISPLSFSALSKNFKGDGYTIEKIVKEDRASIKLLCENHISCKEISVEFDPVTRRPSLIFYRFTDLDQPENKEYDKTITIQINKWEAGTAEAQDYLIPQMISITTEGITGVKGFEDYDVINLLNN